MGLISHPLSRLAFCSDHEYLHLQYQRSIGCIGRGILGRFQHNAGFGYRPELHLLQSLYLPDLQPPTLLRIGPIAVR